MTSRSVRCCVFWGFLGVGNLMLVIMDMEIGFDDVVAVGVGVVVVVAAAAVDDDDDSPCCIKYTASDRMSNNPRWPFVDSHVTLYLS